jgi:hypothetical protein
MRRVNTNKNNKIETELVVENYYEYSPAVSSERNRKPKAPTPTKIKTQDDTTKHTCTGTRNDTTTSFCVGNQSCDDPKGSSEHRL